MKLVSWNLNGLEDRDLDMRTEAAMFHMLLGAPIEAAVAEDFKLNSPDIVVLQEVTEHTFFAHVLPHLQAAGFTVYPPEPTIRSYFEVIAVRTPKFKATYHSFDYSDQGRGLTILELDDLSIMTAHLESMKQGKAMRINQTKFVLEEMTKHRAVIFAGDTNLRNEEWGSINAGEIEDAWSQAGSPKSHRVTWLSENRKSRFDRVWSKQIRINNFETFGRENVPEINSPSSDHLGVRVEFEPL